MWNILKDWRILLLGLASWALPFAASVVFFNQSGELVIDRMLFKSLMVVIGATVGVLLLLKAFTRVPPSWKGGLSIGLYWLAINLVLDLVVLVSLFGMNLREYIFDIGLRYLLIPVIAAAMGRTGECAAR